MKLTWNEFIPVRHHGKHDPLTHARWPTQDLDSCGLQWSIPISSNCNQVLGGLVVKWLLGNIFSDHRDCVGIVIKSLFFHLPERGKKKKDLRGTVTAPCRQWKGDQEPLWANKSWMKTMGCCSLLAGMRHFPFFPAVLPWKSVKT